MGAREHEEFLATLNWLIESDGFLDLFEFTLQRVLRRHLEASRGGRAANLNRYGQIDDLQSECVILLSCLAHQGQQDAESAAVTAYQAGLKLLALSGAPNQPLPQPLCKLDALGAALDKMAAASFPVKKKILAACDACANSDGEICLEERELLRAISDSLGCPVPPR